MLNRLKRNIMNESTTNEPENTSEITSQQSNNQGTGLENHTENSNVQDDTANQNKDSVKPQNPELNNLHEIQSNNDQASENNAQNSDNHVLNTPGNIVLQWLTYAFWGWTVLAMSFLTAAVIAYFINDTNSADAIVYGIAGIAVLMPISIICDYFYKKHEPVKKTGSASIVMVIHAVIFALFGVGAIIAAVFSVVALMLATGDTKSYYTTIFSSIIIAVLYAAVLLRTLNPRKMPWVRRFFPISMVIVIGVIGIIGILGPFMGQKSIKNDQMKEAAISNVSGDIETYVSENKQLPDNLDTIKNNANDDAKVLLENGSITYKKSSNLTGQSLASLANSNYYYQLCAKFDKASKDSTNKKNSYSSSDLDNAYHDKGDYCYQIKVTNYSSSIYN